jgi:nucleotide-binding universal stress UspA family protein
MYSRILFAVDDDAALAGAVPVVAAYARRWAAEVRVLHVHRIGSGAANGANRRMVQEVVDRLRSAGVRAEGEVRQVDHRDAIGPAIANAATREGADLVAIGSRGRSDLGGLFLGSVSHDASGGLSLPVLVLRASCAARPEPARVLVGVDGSPASDEAVTEAAEIAASSGASVVVVHVSQVFAANGVTIVEPEEDAHAVLRRAVAAVVARGVRAIAEAPVSHSAANGIVVTAERDGADLVVLGSRRPSRVDGLLMGSVAHEAIHRLRCPVLLARRVASAEPVG